MDIAKWLSERDEFQLNLLNFSREFWEKLLNSKVLIIGLGGVGSVVVDYLARVGVGKIGVVDNERVELKDLNKCIFYNVLDVDKNKAEVIKYKVNNINPDIEIITHNLYLDDKSITSILESYDVIVDCTNNIILRYLVNDVCYFIKKPVFINNVFGYNGEVSLIIPDSSPCYRCFFPKPPSSGFSPLYERRGVLNVTLGIIGCLQANEIIKYILGIGEGLAGFILFFDSLESEVRKIKIKRNPLCELCGKTPKIVSLNDTMKFCREMIDKVEYFSQFRKSE